MCFVLLLSVATGLCMGRVGRTISLMMESLCSSQRLCGSAAERLWFGEVEREFVSNVVFAEWLCTIDEIELKHTRTVKQTLLS